MALAIDGSGATGVASTVSFVAATITTTLPNDIILACIHCETTGSPGRTVNSVSGGGLTWARRKQLTYQPSTEFQTIEIWWAASASALTSQTITATFSGAIDDCSLQLIAVNGVVNLASPWDSNASLPAINNVAAGTTSAIISTSSAPTILLGFAGSAANVVLSNGAGFTKLYNTANAGGVRFSYTCSEYQVFATAQSGYSASFSTTSLGYGVVFDALTALAATTSSQNRVMVLA